MNRRVRVSPFGVLIALGIANHLVLTGSRVAVSLNALALGESAAMVGGLMALFALLPMFLAIPAGAWPIVSAYAGRCWQGPSESPPACSS